MATKKPIDPRGLTIAVDFDGTVVKHRYPNVGPDIGAAPVLKALVRKGARLILFTMRSGKELQDAVDWYAQRQIPLFGIQTNPEQKSWTTSPKAFADIYIDDAALGAPLVENVQRHVRPWIDWNQVEKLFKL